MSYTCYLGGALWPTPEKLQVKIKGKNKTLVLLNEGEVNFLRAPGLTELTVPFDLPMLTGSRSPDYYLGLLERMKANKETTQFMLVRMSPSGGMLFDTNIKVSVEDYNITEDGKKGLDVAVDVNLKQWRDYGTKTVTVEEPKAESTTPTVTVEKERDEAEDKLKTSEDSATALEKENNALLALYTLQQEYLTGNLDGCRLTLQEFSDQKLDELLPEGDYATVLCGSNRQMLYALQMRSLLRVQAVGFTSRVAQYMDSADLLVSKPGGISITEAACKGVPMLLADLVGGCETRNQAFFAAHGWAELCDTGAIADSTLSLLADNARRQALVEAQRRDFDGQAAARVAEAVLCRCGRTPAAV